MRTANRICLSLICFLWTTLLVQAENGQELWLRTKNSASVDVVCKKQNPTIALAVKELKSGWNGEPNARIELIVKKDKALKADGFKLSAGAIQANTDKGLLYGVFELLRRQQTKQLVTEEVFNPSYELRILNHWDNLDGTVERGYSGHSIFWNDDQLYENISESDLKRWTAYARANASIGINGIVVNNVNAKPEALTLPVLNRVKTLAGVMRPYGIKVYMCINFSSPAKLGGLADSDPLNKQVIDWWKSKVKEIYGLMPDFGGFLVKANSEGLPGPQDYGRTHADGANMLADALKPYGGLVMWRAFVYASNSNDRAKQAYNEFVPLDGKFRDNVILQIKNGPIDFQPREPFSPLFGALKRTSIMPELQITQEYLGHSFQLVYLAPMWEEVLHSDTYQYGKGSTVAKCTDGSLAPQAHTAIAGVANVGLDANWCGHTFAQANWYAFGRLAWNNTLTSSQIANEWVKLTFSRSKEDLVSNKWETSFLEPVRSMMLESWEACVNYSMPLGLHHIFAAEHHYGPGPWYAPEGVRKDWTPPYYHQANAVGIGFDRSKTGTDAVSQYKEPLAAQFGNLDSCPEKYLLFFHHVPWDYRMKNNRTLWDELCHRYDSGLQQVKTFQCTWDKVESFVDAERFSLVQSRLRRQNRDAQIWKDGCLLYFQQFSKRPIPFSIERPVNDLDSIKTLNLGWTHHN
jgi:alpha-glucuronidase